jgi:UDP-glucose 4-epimerase
MTHYFVAGGAGFIGSHLVRRLLQRPEAAVVVFDNFSSGRVWHLKDLADCQRLRVMEGDLKQLDLLTKAVAGAETVFHLASNPDIARAATHPDIDFWEGTYLTQNLLEAMRLGDVRRIVYASGSGVYGEAGTTAVAENHSPLQPISTYGASKLACEALIGSYCHMFAMQGVAFRFANVVGPRQTHGVAYDFIRRLLRDPSQLDILGDGRQSKSYIHVQDVLDALLLLNDGGWHGFDVYNLATEDYVTVGEIADLVRRQLGLGDVVYRFSGGDRGWKGDVPVVRFDTSKIRARGWTNRRTSIEALRDAIESMIGDARSGRFD